MPESAGVEPVHFDDGLERVVVVANARVRGASAVPGNHGHKDSVAWMSGCVHSPRRIIHRLPIVSCVCSKPRKLENGRQAVAKTANEALDAKIKL